MSRKGSLLRIKEKIMAKLWADFYDCFIDAKTYLLYLEGLRNTVFIALIACAIGFVIGVVVTAVRIAPKTNLFVCVADAVARVYVTVIRGTPVVLQLFIGYFVIFATMKFSGLLGISNTDGIPVAGLVFGINSGAYMSEILRGGINSVDYGQTEAGRSLGLSWSKTFVKIVLPQAFKSTIPTIFNEFITLLKETSVAGYVGIYELTKVREDITTANMQLYMPLFIIAAMYLILVLLLQQLQKLIERRLTKGDKQRY